MKTYTLGQLPLPWYIRASRCEHCGHPGIWQESTTPINGKVWIHLRCMKCGKLTHVQE